MFLNLSSFFFFKSKHGFSFLACFTFRLTTMILCFDHLALGDGKHYLLDKTIMFISSTSAVADVIQAVSSNST